MSRAPNKMAGILKYFKTVQTLSSSSLNLLDPDGPLSRKVPAKAIELANAKVSEVIEKSHTQAPYLYLTSGQRYEVGKRAAEYGVTATLKYYAGKYPNLPLKETTTRRLKNLYKDTFNPKRKSKKADMIVVKLTEDDKPQRDESVENSDKEPAEPEEVKELPRQKTGDLYF